MATSSAPTARMITYLVIFLSHPIEKQRFKSRKTLQEKRHAMHSYLCRLFLDKCHERTCASLCTMVSRSPESAPNAAQGMLTEG